MKGESVSEILGFVDTMERHMVKVELTDPDAIDVCGTGGDGSGTFNVSTTVALIAAAGGVSVAKHGNRSVSSRSGSADLLQALGIRIDLSPQQTVRCIQELNFGFFFAPLYHPAMKVMGPHRKNLKLRTIFNLLGPLLNPARVRRQLIGAFNPETARKLAGVLQMRGAVKACTVHAEDGLDEVSAFAPTRVFETSQSAAGIREFVYRYPEANGFTLAETIGRDSAENARITLSVLEGRAGAPREITVANAAFAFYVADKVGTINEGIALAQEVIDSGLALRTLQALREMTHSFEQVAV